MVALTWIAVRVLGSDAGYLSALEFFVLLLSVLGIGRWADRWDQLRSMIGADLCRAAILLAVVGLWLASGRPTVAGLVAAIFVLACGQAVFEPALQSVLPFLVDDVQLLPASNGLLDATDRSARLIGPGLVALFGGHHPGRSLPDAGRRKLSGFGGGSPGRHDGCAEGELPSISQTVMGSGRA